MKKLFCFLYSILLTFAATAQNHADTPRGRIENVTDYSQPIVSRHRRIGSRATAPLPCTGSPKIPVVLVQFDDLKFTADTLIDKTIEHSDQNVNALFYKFFNGNMDGTYYKETRSQGAVRDYFATVSDSLFLPEFTVFGPVTLPRGYAYYGKDRLDADGEVIAKDINIDAFYNASCRLAVENFDANWNDFDNNGDGKIDLVFFIYAGEGQNANGVTTDAIWPKEGTSSLYVKLDDKTIVFGAFGCTNEIFNNMVDGIGTSIHEVSHGLGLCDHYDITGEHFGMDYWDIMDSGNYCNSGYQPCNYSAYEKDFMGWKDLQRLPLDQGMTITLDPISEGGTGYKLVDPNNSNNYYILENRQNTRYDGYLGLTSSGRSILGYSALKMTHGLMVTYIQYHKDAWNRNLVNTDHEYLTIIPADGEKISSYNSFTKEYFESILGDLYPGSKNVTTLELLGQTFEIIENNEDKTITLIMNGGAHLSVSDIITSDIHPVTIHSASGVPQSELRPGINIVKYSDNTIRKVMKR